MAQETKKNNKAPEKSKEAEYYYLDENVKEYQFADYVRLKSTPRGIILCFGKLQVDNKKFAIFKEILLPFDVAEALSKIIEGVMKDLLDKGLITAIEPKKEKEQ